MTNTTIAVSEDVHSELKGLKIIERESFSEVIRRILDENMQYRIEESLDNCEKLRHECGVNDPDFYGNCANLACYQKCLDFKYKK